MKRLTLLFLSVVITAFMCSCTGFGANIADSLSPPKLSGELYDIQKELEAYAGENMKLVYPSAGAYRSAIVTDDLDGDGKFEAFSFYSTETDDKTTVMHLNFIRWTGEGWSCVSDLQVDCSGVESIEFKKLDGNLLPKIIVNWSRLSSLNNQISVYEIDSGKLTELVSANYSVYTTCDFNVDGINDIVAIYLDNEKKNSTATLLSFNESGITASSTCVLDGTVTSYYKPRLSKFTDGTQAIFIDADKATGVITEVIYLKDGQLVNAFPSSTGENNATLRTSSIRSEDIDGDGCIDIPLAEKLPSAINSNMTDSAYVTVWNSFNGTSFKPIQYSLINYTDGYSLKVPENWVGQFTVTRRTDINQRIVLWWNSETETEGEEILRLQVLSVKEWEENRDEYGGFSEITRDSKKVYAVRFGSSGLNPGEQYIKDNFKLINADDSGSLKN